MLFVCLARLTQSRVTRSLDPGLNRVVNVRLLEYFSPGLSQAVSADRFDEFLERSEGCRKTGAGLLAARRRSAVGGCATRSFFDTALKNTRLTHPSANGSCTDASRIRTCERVCVSYRGFGVCFRRPVYSQLGGGLKCRWFSKSCSAASISAFFSGSVNARRQSLRSIVPTTR